MLNLFIRKIVGWALQCQTVDLLLVASNIALLIRKRTELIHRSEQGNQYRHLRKH